MLNHKTIWLVATCGTLLVVIGIVVAMPRREDSVGSKYRCEVCGKAADSFSDGSDGPHQFCELHSKEYQAVQANWLAGTTNEGIDHEARVMDQITVFGSRLDDGEIHEILKSVASTQREVDKRVLSIRHMAKNAVEVRTGEQRGPLSGGGHIIRLRKIDGAWKIVQTANWLS